MIPFLFLHPKFKRLGKTSGGQPIHRHIGQILPGADILVALLLTVGQFLHDTFLGDNNRAIFFPVVHFFQDVFLLVGQFVDYHLQVVIVSLVFEFYVLDRLFYPEDLVVLTSDVDKFGVDSLLKLLFIEQKFAVIQRLISLNPGVIDLILVFFTKGEFLILLKQDLTLPFQLLEIWVERLIDRSDTIDNNNNENVVRTDPRTD